MNKNKIQIILDENGKYLSKSVSVIKANADYAYVIELIAPISLENSVIVSYLLYDLKNKDLYQYLESTTDKGSDVIDNTDPLFETVKNYSVFRVAIKEPALESISKYSSGKVGISFTIREKHIDENGINLKGNFGSISKLPDTANDGDYYICDLFTYQEKGLTFTRGDIAYFFDNQWKKGNSWTISYVTTTINVAVDPTIKASKSSFSLNFEEHLKDIVDYWNIKLGKEVIKKIKVQGVNQTIKDATIDLDIFDSEIVNPGDFKAPTTKLLVSEVARLKQYVDNEITKVVNFEISKLKQYIDSETLKIINAERQFSNIPKVSNQEVALYNNTVKRLNEGVTTAAMWNSSQSNMASFADNSGQGVNLAMTIKGASGAAVGQIAFAGERLWYRFGHIVAGRPAPEWRVLTGGLTGHTKNIFNKTSYKNNDVIVFDSNNVSLIVEKIVDEDIDILGTIEIDFTINQKNINIAAFDKGKPLAVYLEKQEEKYILHCPENENIVLSVVKK